MPSKNEYIYLKQTIFYINTITPKEVTDLTGFMNIFELLSYVIIVCDGDIDLLTQKSYSLS